MQPTNQAMVSEVSICNQALLTLGQSPINSLEDQSTTAQWMRNNYPFIRDAVIESRMWTFATVREESTTADMDAWGQHYSHRIPPNWMTVYRCYHPNGIGSQPVPIKWRLESGRVLADLETIWMWGLEYVTDTGRFTPGFVQALAARLAADASIPFTENRALQADCWNLYEVKLKEAAARDGEQGTNDRLVSDTLIRARGMW